MNTAQLDVIATLRLLVLTAKHDIRDSLMWNSDLEFAIDCSDVFAWACADAEDITSDQDIDALAQAVQDAGDDGPLLYCARRRHMRPQGAMYDHLKPANWSHFDACGPVRETGVGNPTARP